MNKLIIGSLGIIFLCCNCSVATKGYVSTELGRQQKQIESSTRALDSLFVIYRAQIDSNKQQVARLTEQQQTLKTSARSLDSLLSGYQAQIDTNDVRLRRLLAEYDNLQSEMQVVRTIDIPNLQTRDQQFETLTESLKRELKTLSRQSLQELADMIEDYLRQTDSLPAVDTLYVKPDGTDEPAPDEARPTVPPDSGTHR